jgi:hypothetical protein
MMRLLEPSGDKAARVIGVRAAGGTKRAVDTRAVAVIATAA